MTSTKDQATPGNELVKAISGLLQEVTEDGLTEMGKDEKKSLLEYAKEQFMALPADFLQEKKVKRVHELLESLPKDLDVLSDDQLSTSLQAIFGLYSALVQEQATANEVTAQDQSAIGSELNRIDFYRMIAGPLNAVVQAQATAAMTSITFMKEVGFDKDSNGNITGIRKVEFMYENKTGEKNADGTDKVVDTKISVPLLSMINIPSLRIQEVDIAFNAKINGIEELRDQSTFKVDAQLGIKFGPVNFKASASYQRTTTSGSKVEREYSMAVKVKATQDEIPAGLEKILGLLAA